MCVVAMMGNSTFLLVGRGKLMPGGSTVGKNVVEVMVVRLPGGKEPERISATRLRYAHPVTFIPLLQRQCTH